MGAGDGGGATHVVGAQQLQEGAVVQVRGGADGVRQIRGGLKSGEGQGRRASTRGCRERHEQTAGPPGKRGGGGRGCRNEKKKLGVSNTPYDGGRWVTDGGWWVTDGGWWITDGGWWVADGGWWVTDGGWWITDGGWWVADGGWWVATKHQRVDAIVKRKKKG